jgi:ethanolamine permease
MDVFLSGLAIKLGGCVASWHNGFAIGFWSYFVCFVIVALGYLVLTLCVAEMISVISFPGGYYGYVRCSMGPLLGFLVGCSGLVESIFFWQFLF